MSAQSPTRFPRARRALCIVALTLGACTGDVRDTQRRPGEPGASQPGAFGTGGNPSTVGGAGITADGESPPNPRPMSLEGAPIYSRFVRLTNEQWQRAVQDILGLDQAPDAAHGFEQPVAGTTDFANNEHVLSVTNALWQSYQLASEQAAEAVTGSSAKLSALYSGTDAAGFIRKLGRRAFRRPLSADEEQSYGTLFTQGSAGADASAAFAKGAALVVSAMLQSPYFLYRTELGDDGAALSGYEVASKLSFWLLGTTPNDALLDAASAGELDTPDGAVQYATQMLEQPAALDTMRELHRQLLHLDLYTTLSKVGVSGYTEDLNLELEQASYRFFERIYSQGLGLREILTSTTGYVGPAMAAVYGMAAPASGLEERDLGPARTGYFAQLPYLALYAFNEQPDPIHRGLTLNLDFLCADPGKPLANLPPIPPLMPGQTNREMITTLTGGCGRQCHTYYINPLGFAFENFDGMGRLRSMDNGKPVDTAAAYPFAEGYKQFSGASDLMQIMASSKQAHACYAKKIAGYALQRDIVQSDLATLDALSQVSMTGGSIKQVMLALVADPAFRMRHGGSP
jgi:uncharacterized protein DUF1592/uncharacterized protein DUF1595/uncharacterized protein DUF1588/uncharacterized protein DUF1585/uncharacterized protein DUF1587